MDTLFAGQVIRLAVMFETSFINKVFCFWIFSRTEQIKNPVRSRDVHPQWGEVDPRIDRRCVLDILHEAVNVMDVYFAMKGEFCAGGIAFLFTLARVRFTE